MGVKGRRYKLWWSGNSDGTGGVGVLVKEELGGKVVEVEERQSDDSSDGTLGRTGKNCTCVWSAKWLNG